MFFKEKRGPVTHYDQSNTKTLIALLKYSHGYNDDIVESDLTEVKEKSFPAPFRTQCETSLGSSSVRTE